MKSTRRFPRAGLLLVLALSASGVALLSSAWSIQAGAQGVSRHLPITATRMHSTASIPFQQYDMTFEPQTATSADISETAALASAEKVVPTALGSDGSLLPNVHVEDAFGTWSSNVIATMDSNGRQQLLYQGVPVWVVSLSGSGFNGGLPDGTLEGRHTVVVDATTGKPLIGFR